MDYDRVGGNEPIGSREKEKEWARKVSERERESQKEADRVRGTEWETDRGRGRDSQRNRKNNCSISFIMHFLGEVELGCQSKVKKRPKNYQCWALKNNYS